MKKSEFQIQSELNNIAQIERLKKRYLDYMNNQKLKQYSKKIYYDLLEQNFISQSKHKKNMQSRTDINSNKIYIKSVKKYIKKQIKKVTS